MWGRPFNCLLKVFYFFPKGRRAKVLPLEGKTSAGGQKFPQRGGKSKQKCSPAPSPGAPGSARPPARLSARLRSGRPGSARLGLALPIHKVGVLRRRNSTLANKVSFRVDETTSPPSHRHTRFQYQEKNSISFCCNQYCETPSSSNSPGEPPGRIKKTAPQGTYKA